MNDFLFTFNLYTPLLFQTMKIHCLLEIGGFIEIYEYNNSLKLPLSSTFMYHFRSLPAVNSLEIEI